MVVSSVARPHGAVVGADMGCGGSTPIDTTQEAIEAGILKCLKGNGGPSPMAAAVTGACAIKYCRTLAAVKPHDCVLVVLG